MLQLLPLLLAGLSFSYSGNAYFPWSSEHKVDKEELYKLQINTQATNFFTEDKDEFRYSAGADLIVNHSLFDISTSYTYNLYEDYHYFRPREFSLKFERPDGKWAIGRVRTEWDWADLFWNRGLWQPRYSDDALRPQEAGLTGLFRDFKYEGGQAILFGSIIFIPDFTSPFKTENGNIISDNPWFIPPPTGKLASTTIVPSYSTIDPDLQDFLLPSIGGRVSYKGMYLAYAYKPMNKIRTKTSVSLPLDEEPRGSYEDGFLVDTPLHPVILHHHLLGGGFTLESTHFYENNTQEMNYRLKTSVVYSHPEKHVLEKETLEVALTHDPPNTYTLEKKPWIFFQPRNEWHLSAKGEIHVKDPFEETIVHAAYTHRFPFGEKEETTLEKALTNVQKLFFQNNLFEFSRAASVGIDHIIKFNETQEAKIKSRLIYNLIDDYFLFSFYGSLKFIGSFTVFLSGNLVFSEFPFSFEQTTEDIGVYTNKSGISGGLSYAF